MREAALRSWFIELSDGLSCADLRVCGERALGVGRFLFSAGPASLDGPHDCTMIDSMVVTYRRLGDQVSRNAFLLDVVGDALDSDLFSRVYDALRLAVANDLKDASPYARCRPASTEGSKLQNGAKTRAEGDLTSCAAIGKHQRRLAVGDSDEHGLRTGAILPSRKSRQTGPCWQLRSVEVSGAVGPLLQVLALLYYYTEVHDWSDFISRVRINFKQPFRACRRRTPRAGSNRRVASERSR